VAGSNRARFVDDPSASIQDADRLVNDVMETRLWLSYVRIRKAASKTSPWITPMWSAIIALAHEIALQRDPGNGQHRRPS